MRSAPAPLRTAGGMATACKEAITVSESSDESDRRSGYELLIKPGDAVETPDGEVWVVERWGAEENEFTELALLSASRDKDGTVYADHYDDVRTIVPLDYVTKVADARRVRRSPRRRPPDDH